MNSTLEKEVITAGSGIGGAFLVSAITNHPQRWEKLAAMGGGAVGGVALTHYILGNSGLSALLARGIDEARAFPKTFAAGAVAMAVGIQLALSYFVVPELGLVNAIAPILNLERIPLLAIAGGLVAALLEFTLVGYPIAIFEWLVGGAKRGDAAYDALRDWGSQKKKKDGSVKPKRNFYLMLTFFDMLLIPVSMPAAIVHGAIAMTHGHGFLPLLMSPAYGAMGMYYALGSATVDMVAGIQNPTDPWSNGFAAIGDAFKEAAESWNSVFDTMSLL